LWITKALSLLAEVDLQLEVKATRRFPGLELSEDERRTLKKDAASGAQMTARRWRRIRTLLKLDEGISVRETARLVGGYPREVSRVGQRYLAEGLESALTERARPGRKQRKLDSTQEAAVVAMICGPAPEGRARWTIRLAAEQAEARGIIDKIGREAIRMTLSLHGLKPWREKNVGVAIHRSGVR
jgi:hypothetical protein